jgi:hypothetical protein
MNKEEILKVIRSLERQIAMRQDRDEDCINWLGYANVILARSALLKEIECLD